MRNPDPIHEYHRMVSMFLDQQLNDDENRQVLHQAQENPEFQRVLRTEQNFRDLIKKNVVQRPQATSRILENIKSRISNNDPL
jgi:glucose-6-phosphate isomerase